MLLLAIAAALILPHVLLVAWRIVKQRRFMKAITKGFHEEIADGFREMASRRVAILREQVEKNGGRLGMISTPKTFNWRDAMRYFSDPLNFVHPPDTFTRQEALTPDEQIDAYLAAKSCKSCRGEGCPDCAPWLKKEA